VLWLALLALVVAPSVGAVEAEPLFHAAAAELHVCPSGCACSSLQAAIQAAAPYDVIKVASGTYTDVHEMYVWGNPSYSARQVAYITKSLTIAGGYTVTDWVTPDPVANPTLLDAGGEGRVVHAWDDSNVPITVTLRGLQIIGGDTTTGGTYNGIHGGGIYARMAHLTVEDCRVEGNQAPGTSGNGAGIYSMQGSLSLTGTVLTHNEAGRDGGGLYLHDAPLLLVESEVVSNSAQNSGGGVHAYNMPSIVRVERTLFHDNWAHFGGGGLLLNGPDGTLVDTDFTANRAGEGAGLASNLGALEITRGVFSGNVATGQGGALLVESAGALTVTRSLLQENSAGGEGGAAMVYNSSAFFESVAVVDNASAVEGSGLWFESVDATLHHLTLARNTGGNGTGLHITHVSDNSRFSDVQVVNTIIAGHDLGVFLDIGDAASLNTVLWESNTINRSGAIAVSNNRSGEANFAPDGYHIMPGSDAFEQGNPNYLPLATWDIDGDPRPMKSGYDIGADELPFQTEMYRDPWSGDVSPGDQVEFWFKIINWAPSTYTVAYTYTVPACLIPQGAITGTGMLSSGFSSWFSPRIVFEVAPGATGPCTKTVTFVTAEGLQGSASLAVNVAPPPNTAPTITTAPVTTATQDVTYTYTVIATDPDLLPGETLTFTAPALPLWLSLNRTGATTATLSGTPTDADVGDHPILLQVTDSGWLSDTQAFTLTVSTANDGSISTTVSGSTGGLLVYEESGAPAVEVAIPTGAVTETTTLVYTPALTPTGAPGTLSFAGRAFDLSAYRDGLLLPAFDFETGITITLHYTEDQIAGLDEETLTLAYWDGGSWTVDGITPIERDVDANSVSFWVTHLTDFALFASSASDFYVYLPLVVRSQP
jgi:predicted outer membrane repeat protein